MKPRAKKLMLQKEILRVMTGSQLSRVVGGTDDFIGSVALVCPPETEGCHTQIDCILWPTGVSSYCTSISTIK